MKSDINGWLYFVNLFFIYATGSCMADMDRYAAFWMGFIHSLFREKTHGLQGRIKKIPQLLQLWDSEGVCSCFCLKLRQVCVSMAAFLLAFFCFPFFGVFRQSNLSMFISGADWGERTLRRQAGGPAAHGGSGGQQLWRAWGGNTSMSSMDYHHSPLMLWMAIRW